MTRELPKPEQITATPANFFEATTAMFTACAKPERPADYVSASGSAYWYTEAGVVRCADHWGGNVASCNWFLEGERPSMYCERYDEERAGFCAWDAFTSDPWAIAAREICEAARLARMAA